MPLSQRVLLALALVAGWSVPARAADLNLDGTTITLGGIQPFDNVVLKNGAKIIVTPYNGTDRVNTGNLQIRAHSISIDATSSISARGAGYQHKLCDNGAGPAATPLAGGRGGCGVRDSGGGGAHFGGGGRGTKDIGGTASFPRDFEEDCVGAVNMAGNACASYTDCRNNDGLPTVAGQPYFHSIYQVEFGAAGGDKGCRDNDGFDIPTGGNGGGRVVLAAVVKTTDMMGNVVPGSLTINGTIDANGFRGCGNGNDSAGGGAGGSVLLVGDTVSIGASAKITAAGGLGGDTQAKTGQDAIECAGAQTNGTCDDCGGGGGGGIVNVLSGTASISTGATFSVSGSFGGVCPVCRGEAGGEAGKLQIDGAYVGEICDGFDNDFDGVIDNGFTNSTCGLGLCAVTQLQCSGGSPPICAPTTNLGATCIGSRGTSRPRVALLLDTSASMLLDLPGTTTFGDGSGDHPGIDTGTDGKANDSRLFLAKDAASQLISAYPDIDFALARYHQDEATNRSCQTAKWLECQGSCCSYDNPDNQIGTSATACTLTLARQGGGTITKTVHEDSLPAKRCINYAGTCGSPRRGADILVGFESDVRQYLSWLDGGETGFNPSAIPGNFCGGLGGDCELRGTGPTPIAESLRALYDYVTPIQATDPAVSCRGYSVILVSDGGEECGGNPVTAAAELLAKGIKTFVIGVSVNAAQGATLTAIAVAGGTTNFIPVNDQSTLLPALVSIVSASIKTELCNGVDDNCNGQIDEGYNVGLPCDDGKIGACKGTGTFVCNASHQGTTCQITAPGVAPKAELCNNKDDNCNGLVDEGNPEGGGACGSAVGECKKGTLQCQGGALACIGDVGPSPETCNGKDDDCNGTNDNGVPPGGPCGSSIGECKPGTFVCQGALGYVCQGAVTGTPETCNGKDDDCNGAIDDNVPGTGVACSTASDGSALCKPGVVRCIAGQIKCVGGTPFHPPQCTCPPDDCSLPSDGGGTNGCPGGSACIGCACRTPCAASEFPCSGTLVCRDGFCVPPECGGKLCQSFEMCVNNTCVDQCTQKTCPTGQVCTKGECVENTCYGKGCPAGQICKMGGCQADPCVGVQCSGDQFCVGGQCVTTCEGVYCPSGKSCQNGACVGDPCGGVMCNDGETCTVGTDGKGQCAVDPCQRMSCGLGRVCKAGDCIDDPCAGVRCPGDPALVSCKLGQCQPNTPPPPPAPEDRAAASGGGGVLSCAVGGEVNGGQGWLVLAGLLFLWRAVARRRARGAL